MKLRIQYLPTMRRYGPEMVKDFPIVKEVNRSYLDPKDFWNYGSMYIQPDNLERFIMAADLLGIEVINVTV